MVHKLQLYHPPILLHTLLINCSKYRKNECCTAEKTKQNGRLNQASGNRAYVLRIKHAIVATIRQHLDWCSSGASEAIGPTDAARVAGNFHSKK